MFFPEAHLFFLPASFPVPFLISFLVFAPVSSPVSSLVPLLVFQPGSPPDIFFNFSLIPWPVDALVSSLAPLLILFRAFPPVSRHVQSVSALPFLSDLVYVPCRQHGFPEDHQKLSLCYLPAAAEWHHSAFSPVSSSFCPPFSLEEKAAHSYSYIFCNLKVSPYVVLTRLPVPFFPDMVYIAPFKKSSKKIAEKFQKKRRTLQFALFFSSDISCYATGKTSLACRIWSIWSKSFTLQTLASTSKSKAPES